MLIIFQIIKKFISLNLLTQLTLISITIISIYSFYNLLIILLNVNKLIKEENNNIDLIETDNIFNKNLISGKIYLENMKIFNNSKNYKEILLENYNLLFFEEFNYKKFFNLIILLSFINVFFNYFTNFINYLSLTTNVVFIFINELLYLLIIFLIFKFKTNISNFHENCINYFSDNNLDSLKEKKTKIIKPEDIMKNFIMEDYNDKFIIHGQLTNKKIALTKIIKNLNKLKDYNIVFFINQKYLEFILNIISELMPEREMHIVQNQEDFYEIMLNFMKNHKNSKEEIILLIKHEIN